MPKQSLGLFIQALRLQRGLTQNDLSKRADTAIATISALERDKNSPQRGTAERIVDALRSLQEFSASERTFAQKHMNLPEDYHWDNGQPPQGLTWDHINKHDQKGLQPWINHCVREMTLVVGQEQMLDLLLTTARNKDITIPETPSV